MDKYRQLVIDVRIPEDKDTQELVYLVVGVINKVGCEVMTTKSLIDARDVSQFYENQKSEEKQPDTIIELCPLCGEEVEMANKFEIQECTECGYPELKPCGICEVQQCSVCPLGDATEEIQIRPPENLHDTMLFELLYEYKIEKDTVLEDIRMNFDLSAGQSSSMGRVCEEMHITFKNKEEMESWLIDKGIEGFGC